MLSPDFLDILRCPLSPSKTRLVQEDGGLVCERCALRFRIKDGFPILVAEEADLPPGCDSLAQLPCQRETAPLAGAASTKKRASPPFLMAGLLVISRHVT